MAGAILCKFLSGESEIRNLGRYLRGKTTASFQPHFIITEHSGFPMGEETVAISQRVTSSMVEQADFRLADVTISVSGEHAMTNIDLSVVSGHRFPISGFPRALMQKSPPIRKLILKDFSWLCSSTAYIILFAHSEYFFAEEGHWTNHATQTRIYRFC